MPRSASAPPSRAADRLAAAAVVLVAVATAACTTAPRSSHRELRIAGSDTMLLLTRRWAEGFMAATPGIAVWAEGGGSGAGIEALIAGTADIAAASRPLRPDEVRRLHERHGTLGVTVLVAQDALSVLLNPANPVRDLTLLQLKGIFTGRIGTWVKVGGADRPIAVVTRPPNSGTFRVFQELVLDGEAYTARAASAPTTAAVAAVVRNDPAAVGYGGIAYGRDLVHCRIDGVAPAPAAVRDGSYPLARYLYLVTVRPPEEAAKAFVDWVVSPPGQRIVAEVGYIPLWSDGANSGVGRPDLR